MIIACPSCKTHHQLPDDHQVVDGSVIKCATCGHSWLEARAIEVHDVPFEPFETHDNLPVVPQAPDAEYEASRIAKAAIEAEEKQRQLRAKARAKMRGWAILAACVLTPVSLAAAFPEKVVQHLPGAIRIYNKAGISVNIPGFEFSSITHQYVLAGKTRVLAIRGMITNVSSSEKKAPPLQFTLLDSDRKTVYSWKLEGYVKRPLKVGESKTFLTRVASPPKTADDFQIRFAQTGKMGITVPHESH